MFNLRNGAKHLRGLALGATLVLATGLGFSSNAYAFKNGDSYASVMTEVQAAIPATPDLKVIELNDANAHALVANLGAQPPFNYDQAIVFYSPSMAGGGIMLFQNGVLMGAAIVPAAVIQHVLPEA